jgi:hypothetical protein
MLLGRADMRQGMQGAVIVTMGRRIVHSRQLSHWEAACMSPKASFPRFCRLDSLRSERLFWKARLSCVVAPTAGQGVLMALILC